jgi:hypothetical protein
VQRSPSVDSDFLDASCALIRQPWWTGGTDRADLQIARRMALAGSKRGPEFSKLVTPSISEGCGAPG